MNIEKLFCDEVELNRQYLFYLSKKQLRKIESDYDLVISHLEKAKHNMRFFDKNKKDGNFNDWLVVVLYYSLYHAVLALIVNKNFMSKNHSASLIFLIKHYSQLKNDIELLNELLIKKEDAELYTELKEERHKASYETKFSFTDTKIDFYKREIINFIHKVEEIIQSEMNS